MGFIPFSLEEASEICEDFEDLIDTEFKISASPLLLVEDVVIAPFSEADKRIFINSYSDSRNAENALNQYTGSNYDVLLITSSEEPRSTFSFVDIRTFANLRGIKYSFPEE